MDGIDNLFCGDGLLDRNLTLAGIDVDGTTVGVDHLLVGVVVGMPLLFEVIQQHVLILLIQVLWASQLA